MESEKNVYRKNVFICSPYASTAKEPEKRKAETEQNRRQARAACKLAVKKGAVPYAPHLYFTQFLNDDTSDEREMGMTVGLMWLLNCDEVWVIGGRITKGMQSEILFAEENDIPVRFLLDERTEDERLYGMLFGADDIMRKLHEWR